MDRERDVQPPGPGPIGRRRRRRAVDLDRARIRPRQMTAIAAPAAKGEAVFRSAFSESFADFADSLGGRASQLPAIYAAFGLAVPPPGMAMREDEEEAIADFIDLWAMVDDEAETFLRAARIAGEGVRRIQGATQDLFDELGGPPRSQSERGKSPEDALRPAMRLSPVVAQLLVWLQKRHQENEVFARIVSYVERTMVEQGIAERPAEAQAIAFVDLSSYTELTVEAGDARAA